MCSNTNRPCSSAANRWAHDEAAGADDDLWRLDEGLSNGEERFDEGLDKGFDEGSCDKGFNGKWFDDDGLFDRPDDARMVGGGDAAVEICFRLAPVPGSESEGGGIESTSIESLKGRRPLMSVEVGMLDDEVV